MGSWWCGLFDTLIRDHVGYGLQAWFLDWALTLTCDCDFLIVIFILSALWWRLIRGLGSSGNQFWIFTGRTDVEDETPILWPPDSKSQLIGKDPDAGKDWGQEKGMIEDEMVGWHHQHNGHGFGWTSGVGDGQGGLACCDSWGHNESNTTEWLNWTEQRKGLFYSTILAQRIP